ncbi:MAG: hypothetical protein HYR94_21025 [Chloroflexi bacterium]|nr:hypothetical protein [Chloroflexota bacterium]
MPATNFPEYVQEIEAILNAAIAAGEAASVSIQFDQRSALRGFIVGFLQFNDGSELHFREFVDISLPESRLMYAYHYQDANQQLIFRYDNATHRPALPQAEHKHTPSDIVASPAPTLAEVIDEILQET